MNNKVRPSLYIMLKTQLSRLKYWNFFTFIKMVIFEIYYYLISRPYGLKYLFAIDNLNKEINSTDNTIFYSPAPYLFLKQSFDLIKQELAGKIFIDAGCGAGRVLIHALNYPFKKIYGIELSKFLVEIAKNNIEKYKNFKKKNYPEIEIIQTDILNFKIPDEPIVVFMFDPFNEEIASKFIQRLITENKKEIYVIYLSPHKKKLFEVLGFKTIYNFANRYNRGFIILKRELKSL